MDTNKEKFTQLFIILLGLFIFIFFTRGYYSDLIGNIDLNESNKITYDKKLKELNDLSDTKKDLEKASKNTKTKNKEYAEIKKYLEPVSDDKIISDIYGAAENKLVGIKILSLSMSEGVKNELGFLESKINISAFATDKEAIKDFLDYLVNDSDYKIFINSFNMPKKGNTSGYQITIPATIFYVDSNNNK